MGDLNSYKKIVYGSVFLISLIYGTYGVGVDPNTPANKGISYLSMLKSGLGYYTPIKNDDPSGRNQESSDHRVANHSLPSRYSTYIEGGRGSGRTPDNRPLRIPGQFNSAQIANQLGEISRQGIKAITNTINNRGVPSLETPKFSSFKLSKLDTHGRRNTLIDLPEIIAAKTNICELECLARQDADSGTYDKEDGQCLCKHKSRTNNQNTAKQTKIHFPNVLHIGPDEMCTYLCKQKPFNEYASGIQDKKKPNICYCFNDRNVTFRNGQKYVTELASNEELIDSNESGEPMGIRPAEGKHGLRRDFRIPKNQEIPRDRINRRDQTTQRQNGSIRKLGNGRHSRNQDNSKSGQ